MQAFKAWEASQNQSSVPTVTPPPTDSTQTPTVIPPVVTPDPSTGDQTPTVTPPVITPDPGTETPIVTPPVVTPDPTVTPPVDPTSTPSDSSGDGSTVSSGN